MATKRKPATLLSPSGRKIEDLRGKTFGRLTVMHFAKVQNKHSYWCCRCVCGETRTVLGTDLKRGEIKSCGCGRADPETRRAAAMKVPIKKRKERARLAAQACKGKKPPPAYRLNVEQAALRMCTSEEHVLRLCNTGILRWRWSKGSRRVSAQDADAYAALRDKRDKTCLVEETPDT